MNEAADFLVEIGTEELPPKELKGLAEAFGEGIGRGLDEAGLEHGAVETFATPRRLAVRVGELSAAQAAQTVERRGPPVNVAFDATGRPTRAALAFAETCGVTVERLARATTGKGEWLSYREHRQGRPAGELLPQIVQRALDGLPTARRMRWGETEASFVRPVHWAVLLHGSHVVEATLFDHASGNVSSGHRFMAPGPLELAHPSEYEHRLESEGRVIADFDARRRRMLEASQALARECGGSLVYDAALADEITALVEWPVPIAGRIDAEYLKLPPEVLIATLQAHQRCFPLRAEDGRLLDRFIAVANIDSRAPEKIRAGNERVVRSRLADAAFFFAQDRQKTLAARAPELERVVFQQELGSLADKSRRVAAAAKEIAAALGGDPERASRAALLAKCDLLTGMVGEFPELQGCMGRYYAEHDGEDEEVAAAIEEQYKPRFAGDALPVTRTGQVLSLAERVDTLTGIFAIGQRPSGTRDPFALRRTALGLLRILIEGELELDLQAVLDAAVQRQPVAVADGLAEEIYTYVMERLRSYYLEDHRGYRVNAELLDAVLAVRPASPLDCHRRLAVLTDFQRRDEAVTLVAANKRVANILRRHGDQAAAAVDRSLLQDAAETALHDALQSVQQRIAPALQEQRYATALAELAPLRPLIDAFFEQVMVMDEDPRLRANRLALLAELRRLYCATADLSQLPVETA